MRRLLFLALWTALAACSRPADRGPFTLRIAVTGPLARVHPTTNETSAVAAQDLVFHAILYPDRDGKPRSRVARAVERVSATRYRISLDPAVRFSDGSAVTFDDVLRAIQDWDIEARQDGEWIVLESASGALDAKLMYSLVYRESGTRVIGTGAYRILEETPWRIVLERVRSLPGRIDRVELLAYPSTRDALARTLRGETNGVIGITDRQAEFLEGVPSLAITRTPGPHASVVMLNPDRVVPDEAEALRASLPFARIASVGCSPALRNPRLPEVASALPDGRQLSITTLSAGQSTALVGLALRRSLGPRGGALSLPEFTAAAADQQPMHDLTVRNVLVWPPAILALTWGTGGPFNSTKFSNAAVDAAFSRGDADAAAAEIERTAPFVTLCRSERIGAFDARIHNASLGWWGQLDTLPDWEVGP